MCKYQNPKPAICIGLNNERYTLLAIIFNRTKYFNVAHFITRRNARIETLPKISRLKAPKRGRNEEQMVRELDKRRAYLFGTGNRPRRRWLYSDMSSWTAPWVSMCPHSGTSVLSSHTLFFHNGTLWDIKGESLFTYYWVDYVGFTFSILSNYMNYTE